MANGEVCCILGVCCPAGSAAQFTALVHEIRKQRPKMTEDQAEAAATRVLQAHDNFEDVAPLIDEVA